MPKQKTVLVEMTEEAANCLAFFTIHPMYDPDLSKAIVCTMRAWLNRDNDYRSTKTPTVYLI